MSIQKINIGGVDVEIEDTSARNLINTLDDRVTTLENSSGGGGSEWVELTTIDGQQAEITQKFSEIRMFCGTNTGINFSLTCNFVNSLFQVGRSNQDDIDSLEIDDRILNLDGENKYSYILYKGDTKNFNKNKVFSKLKFFTDNKLNLSNSDDPLVEGYLHLHNTSLQVLNESTKNKKSKDYFNRVTFKEVADTLNKYKV